jgi:hypothetical protein
MGKGSNGCSWSSAVREYIAGRLDLDAVAQ